jgi:hypothetical protein
MALMRESDPGTAETDPPLPIPLGPRCVACREPMPEVSPLRRHTLIACPACGERQLPGDVTLTPAMGEEEIKAAGVVEVPAGGSAAGVRIIAGAGVLISGVFRGDLRCQGGVVVAATGSARGSIAAASVMVLEGGLVDASVRLSAPARSRRTRPTAGGTPRPQIEAKPRTPVEEAEVDPLTGRAW